MQKHPRLKRLKWTVDEDKKLTEWVEERGLGTCDWAGFIRHHKDQIDPKRTAVSAAHPFAKPQLVPHQHESVKLYLVRRA